MTKEQNNRRLLSLDAIFMEEEPEKETDLGPVVPPISAGQPNEPPKSAKRGIRDLRDLRRYLDDHLSEETKEKLEQAQRAERSAREAEMLNREAPIPDVLYSDSLGSDETIMEPKPTEKPWEATPASSVIAVPKEEETFDADRTQVFSAVHPEEILTDESDEEITEAVTFKSASPINVQDTARQQKIWPLDEEKPHMANPTPAYADEEAEEKKTEAKGFRGVFFNWILPISVALLLAIVIRFFVGGATTVSGTSMEPTLHNGDFLLVSKIPTYFKNYKRGDVLIIDSPDLNEFYVKRLIGLPGETVEIQDGKVFIDGKWMKEFYTDQETVSYANAKWTLGNNEYFVLGDNRGTGASNDSRLFGPVLAEHIKAVSRLRIWPITKMMLMY